LTSPRKYWFRGLESSIVTTISTSIGVALSVDFMGGSLRSSATTSSREFSEIEAFFVEGIPSYKICMD
jgi:hypothetical protein